MMSKVNIKNSLISVSNKTNIDLLAKELVKLNIKIISTGGTAKFLRKKSINIIDVYKISGFPEILDGRVKTLHPKIFGGILNRPNFQKDEQILIDHKIENIDLIIVNLYEFEKTMKNSNSNQLIIENIDIGGPSLIRASAKNYKFKTIVTDPDDYSKLINQLKKNGCTSLQFRLYLAKKAFHLTSKYDGIICDWFANNLEKDNTLPQTLSLTFNQKTNLRYGENPHQQAAFYEQSKQENKVGSFELIQGKELSYNNLNDFDAALELILEFSDPSVVIIKHANPCGVASSSNIERAWIKAIKTDPTSAFGGIVAFNKPINENLAKHLSNIFLEVLIAPSIEVKAKKILAKKKNLRILISNKFSAQKSDVLQFKSIYGGVLAQTKDNKELAQENFRFVTKRKPSKKELKDLIFAWKVAKHTKSNAIIYAKNSATTGIGAGQMSRIDSAIIAKNKADTASKIFKAKKSFSIGSVVASDAFFPFPDGVLEAANAGITAIIQPGGSIRDKEIIKAANEKSMAMIFTLSRHFKH